MKKIIRIVVLLAFLGLVVYTIVYLYSKKQKAPVVYQTEQAQVRNIIKRTVATGSVVPRKEIEIKPKISGIVEKLYVEPGDKVKSGDLIAKVRVIPNMVSLNEAESRVSRAEIALREVQIDFERKQLLFEKKVIPEADFQAVELKYQNAQEELSAAKDNLQIIKEGATQKKGEITNTLVRSTIDGMVLQVPIEEGNSIIESNNFNDGTTVASVANMNEMIFKGKIDESEVGKLKIGMPLIMRIGAIETQSFGATLEYISPKGVQENGAIQFEIKAAVTLVDSLFIRAGYSANADIVLAKADSVLSISESLIQFEGDNAFVEVETAAQVFERREIKTGLSDGVFIEVKAGISKDDRLKSKAQ
ncbi:MAG: efflux RND transporter periplasmic adaptor subunit [Bacteroidales bacterium]|nr:efflux RND transporter periplasmic adaptor subunit [Bacteroidales bacterium]